MEQVKLFDNFVRRGSRQEVIDEANNWLRANPNIKITARLQSESANYIGSIFTITIWYIKTSHTERLGD